jgi:hypothetical protein
MPEGNDFLMISDESGPILKIRSRMLRPGINPNLSENTWGYF